VALNIAEMAWNEMLLLTKGKTTQVKFVMDRHRIKPLWRTCRFVIQAKLKFA
jgi:hypothetical protein